ncbi:MAG: hypothetical protein RR086_04700 [Clostridia bacterium]
MKKRTILIILSCVLCAFLGLGTWLIIVVNEVPKITVEASEVTVSGFYGKTIDLVGASVKLVSTDFVGVKKNGVENGLVRKGYFSIVDNSDMQAYVSLEDCEESYILLIDKNRGYYYLNCKRDEDTRILFTKIQASIIANTPKDGN